MKTTLVTSLACATAVMAGGATIKNSCTYPIYMWSVGDVQSERIDIAPGKSYTEAFYGKADGGGPSLKISHHPVLDNTVPITQLEYTANDMLWYDLSNIDLGGTGTAPFAGKRVDLAPSYEQCPRVICPAGATYCSEAYNAPDDVRTKACAGDTDLFLEICQPEKMANASYKSLIAARDAKPEAEAEAEAAPVAHAHVHRGLSHVHERIRRSRIFGRR